GRGVQEDRKRSPNTMNLVKDRGGWSARGSDEAFLLESRAMRSFLALALFFFSLLGAACLGEDDRDFARPGEPCDASRPCREGFCYGPVGRQFCSVVCESDRDCPSEFVCEPEAAVGNRICMPGTRCTDDTTCPLGHV